MRALKTMCAAAALVAFLAPGAQADEWNKKTFLTFSGPVQIPGATLSAGTYTFELASPDSSRHVIRVSEKESGRNVGLFMTIPNTRLDPPSDNLIMFSERPAGQPQAIQVWFYPGERTGEEFVYPKAQAIQIAKATKKGVLATEGGGVTTASEADRIASMRGSGIGRVDESGTMTSADDSKATNADSRTAQSTPQSTAAPSTAAPSTTTGTSGAAAPSRSARRTLPRTASNLVAFELLSMLSLAGAFGVRRIRRSAQ